MIFFLALVCAVLAISSAARDPAPESSWEVRSVEGWGNNLDHPEWGSVGIPLLRMAPVAYADGASEPAGAGRMGARELSNIMMAQTDSVPNASRASDFMWQWGQFLDHDLDLTPSASTLESYDIPVPEGDQDFDPYGTGEHVIELYRSIYVAGDSPSNPRQQMNMITAFIDASNVYGSDSLRASTLRSFAGGRLDTSSGGRLLPFNKRGLPNAGGPSSSFYLAGDVRANEQVALTATHTLFVREHNRLCAELALAYPEFSDEALYQRARKVLGALVQIITYREFLPLLLGPDALPAYSGYDPNVNPGVANEFSTAAYRLGHSMLSPTLLRVNRAHKEKVSTSLRDAFFNPKLIHRGGGIAPLLRGLAAQQAQEVDNWIVDGVRNFLFGAPGSGGFDLAALNIQRGRDHGLADYNTVRQSYGLAPVADFSELSSDPELASHLAEVYGNVDDMDLWVAGLAEDHLEGAMSGETFYTILSDQFLRLRDGDRFWYQNDAFFLTDPELMAELEGTTLADIVRRNTRIRGELQDEVFRISD